MFAGRFIIYLVKTSKLATTFSFPNLVDVFPNLEAAHRDLSFGTLFVHQGLLVTALQGGPPLLGDPDLSSNVLNHDRLASLHTHVKHTAVFPIYRYHTGLRTFFDYYGVVWYA